MTITCSGISATQLAQLNVLVAEAAATREIAARIASMLETANAPLAARIAEAEAYAKEIKQLKLEISRLKADQGTAKAQEAIQAGDVARATTWLNIAKKMQVNDVVRTRHGELVFGQQGATGFDPILAFKGKFVNLPTTGESFRYDEEFGVKKLWDYDLVLVQSSGGGTACPANYYLLGVFGSYIEMYKFGNCNEEITWKSLGPESFELLVPRSGKGPENRAQKVIVKLQDGNLAVTLNGKKLQAK